MNLLRQIALLAVLAVVNVYGQGNTTGSPNAGTTATASSRMTFDAPWRVPDWSWAGYETSFARKTAYSLIFYAKDYGAKADGQHNDAPAIQAAINAAAKEGGGVVYLDAGRYAIKSRILISTSGIILRGAGRGRTTLYCPKSLSALDGGKPHYNSNGQSKYSWADGYIKISGKPLFSNAATLLGTVTENKSRGYRALKLSKTDGIKPGDWVRLFMSDPPTGPHVGTLAAELYGNYVGKSQCGNRCIANMRGNKDLVRWAVRVSAVKHPYISLERPLPINVRTKWNAQIHAMPRHLVPQDCGIQDIRIEFAPSKMEPHLKEAGHNGIAVEHALNSWVRNVAVVNSDDAVVVRYSHHITVDNALIYAKADRSAYPGTGVQGHIGIGLYDSADIEIVNFHMMSKYIHDTTVRGTMLAVFHKGRGLDLNLDSHRGAPYATLYSDLDVGKGTRVFTSGGDGANGFPAGALTTFWNIRTSNSSEYINTPSRTAFGPCTYGAMLMFKGRFKGIKCPTYYIKQSAFPQPRDLFVAQVAYRKKRRRKAAKG